MATVNLGAIKFNWKGAYSNSTAYAVDDVVSSGGSSYVCIQAHTNQPVGNATAYWNIMSSAGTNGTNGTDLTSTLTTQGDILYRDGSGLQRLPKGTAGQVLQMNSGATAPEYGNLSSDFVKITSTTISSSVASVSLDGHFSSTYNHYQIVGTGLLFTNTYNTATSGLRARIRQSNADVTSSQYLWGAANGLVSWNGNHDSDVDANYQTDHFRIIQYMTANNQYTGNFVMQVFNPLDTAYRKAIHWQSSSWNLPDGNTSWNQLRSSNGAASYLTSTAATSGFTFYPASGNFTGGTITIYGLKQ